MESAPSVDGKGKPALMVAKNTSNMSAFRILTSSAAGGDPGMSSESCERRIFVGPNTAEPESLISSKVVTTVGNGGRALSLIHAATRSEDRADASRKAPLDKLDCIQKGRKKKFAWKGGTMRGQTQRCHPFSMLST